jgi:hypothetical protein
MDRVIAILAASRGHLDALQAAALAGPRGGWIGAGFVRNAVWDAFSGRSPQLEGLADLDLVHLDAEDASAARDAAFEAALHAARPGLPWSVANQARMAAHNGDAPLWQPLRRARALAGDDDRGCGAPRGWRHRTAGAARPR